MSNVNLTIDDISIVVPQGTTILKAAETAGIKIPSLCYHPDQSIKANCRICMVEVEGMNTLQASCALPATEGLKIKTDSERVFSARKTLRVAARDEVRVIAY